MTKPTCYASMRPGAKPIVNAIASRGILSDDFAALERLR
jgi:hypothetical protein